MNSEYVDGGLLYIHVGGDWRGVGIIDIRGERGLPGQNGHNAHGGGGGGGGGAPGLPGGALYWRCGGNMHYDLTNVVRRGGGGGPPSTGGDTGSGWDIARAQPGKPGSNGKDGRVVLAP